MPITKRQRNRFWNLYIVGMIAFYALAFVTGLVLTGSAAVGFVASFASLFVSMIGFLVLMRRASRP
jgi:drug/metabolite transporter (DMT)-like permease